MASTVEEAATEIERLSTVLRQRRPEIAKRLRYLRGEEGYLRFASAEFREYFDDRYRGFSDNWCLPVAQATAERMTPLGIRMDDDSSRTNADLQRAWVANECDRGFSEAALVFTAAGRAYALVAPSEDPTLPRVTWEHPEQAIVDTDPRTGVARSGLIVWTDNQYDYATLYTPDLVWKMMRPTSKPETVNEWSETPLDGWELRPVNGETFPMGEANPIGEVPLVEMSNQMLLTDDPMSDIEQVISMQDTINLVWAYLLNGLDFASLPQRVAMGADVPTEPILNQDGEEVGERPVELDKLIRERIMFLSGTGESQVSIDEWSPANLDTFSKVIEHAVEHIAAQTRTPPHYLVARMVNTSAESLTISEAGLVSKVGERITYVTPALRTIYRLIALAMGRQDLADRTKFAQIAWKDIQYRSDAQRTDALQKRKAIGYPLEYLLELDGVPPWDIPRVIAMRDKELASDPMAAFAAGLSETGSPVPQEEDETRAEVADDE